MLHKHNLRWIDNQYVECGYDWIIPKLHNLVFFLVKTVHFFKPGNLRCSAWTGFQLLCGFMCVCDHKPPWMPKTTRNSRLKAELQSGINLFRDNPVCVALLLLHMHNLLLPSSYWSEIRRPGVPLVDLWGWVTVLEKAITLAPSTNTMLQVPWTCFRKPTCVENRL